MGRQIGSHLGLAFFHRLDDALRHVRGRQPAGGVGSVEVCHCVEAPAGCRGGVIPRRRHRRQGRAAPARYGSCSGSHPRYRWCISRQHGDAVGVLWGPSRGGRAEGGPLGDKMCFQHLQGRRGEQSTRCGTEGAAVALVVAAGGVQVVVAAAVHHRAWLASDHCCGALRSGSPAAIARAAAASSAVVPAVSFLQRLGAT